MKNNQRTMEEVEAILTATKTVWKYPLEASGHVQSVCLPSGAEVIYAAAQHQVPMIWALVDPTEELLVQRHFVMVGTGVEIEIGYGEHHHIGSFLMDDGNFVFHVFEVKQQ